MQSHSMFRREATVIIGPPNRRQRIPVTVNRPANPHLLNVQPNWFINAAQHLFRFFSHRHDPNRFLNRLRGEGLERPRLRR